jgi:hypothetical protein
MTYDVVALLERMPSHEDVLAALGAVGPQHRVRAVSGGLVIQLCDDDGDPMVSIDAPMYIQVPGEPARLLGAALGDVPAPTWWVEIRAAARDGGSALAWQYAEELVGRAGGRVWAPPPRVRSDQAGAGDG